MLIALGLDGRARHSARAYDYESDQGADAAGGGGGRRALRPAGAGARGRRDRPAQRSVQRYDDRLQDALSANEEEKEKLASILANMSDGVVAADERGSRHRSRTAGRGRCWRRDACEGSCV